MLGFVLFGAFAAFAMGGMFGLFDDDEESPEERVDGAELEQDVGLLGSGTVDMIEAAFADDPVLAAEQLDDGELLQTLDIEDFSDLGGTEGPDLIALPDDAQTDIVLGFGGNDVVLGSNIDNVISGGDGNDLLFGNDDFDQIFGDDGDDTLSGGDGDDLLVGGNGGDVIYGGDGNDNIFDSSYDSSFADDNRAEVIDAGNGDDGIVIEDGVNLVSLGAGADHVMLYTESGDDPGAVITDFDAAEDALLIGVFAPDFVLPEGASSIELGYRLTEIETDLGPATLVEPAVGSAAEAEALGATSVGYAVLLGVTPADLEGAEIRVVVQTEDSDVFADDSIYSIAGDMGATRI